MKRNLFLCFLLFVTSSVSFAQLQNGNFEQGIPGLHAFENGDVPYWQQAHGRAALFNTNTKFARMRSHLNGADGIIQNYSFEKNETYIITYRIKTEDFGNPIFRNNTSINILAANGVIPNTNTYTIPTPVNQELIPDVNHDHFNDYTNNIWKNVTVCYTPTKDFSQLWIYPLLNMTSQGTNGEMYIDDIKITKIVPFMAIAVNGGPYERFDPETSKLYIDCRADTVQIHANNIYLDGVTYSSSTPGMINNGGGSFSFPLSANSIPSFTVTIQGTDPCGNTWRRDIVIERDCCSVSAPTNLAVDYNMFELSWDPVPGAVEYIVSAPPLPQLWCGCSSQLFIPQMTTTTASLTLPQNLRQKCFTWTVTARCADGSLSPRGGQDCYKYQNIFESDKPRKENIQTATVFPNPNKGDMKIAVETTDDITVQVEVHDFYGRLVKTFVEEVRANNTKTIDWNASSQLSKGIYFITFVTENKTITKRVIVE